jgi:hypothetical protein
MTKSLDASTSFSSSARRVGGQWLYPLLLAVQTVGAAVLYWQGLPIYRRLAADITSRNARPETYGWTIAASLLIQIAYWISYYARLSPPRIVNTLFGHIVLFAARMIFLLATAFFLLVFISKGAEIELEIWRNAVIFFGLFSLFCYTRELERFGNRLLGKEGVR